MARLSLCACEMGRQSWKGATNPGHDESASMLQDFRIVGVYPGSCRLRLVRKLWVHIRARIEIKAHPLLPVQPWTRYVFLRFNQFITKDRVWYLFYQA